MFIVHELASEKLSFNLNSMFILIQIFIVLPACYMYRTHTHTHTHTHTEPRTQEFVVNSGGSINRDEAVTTGQYAFTFLLPLTDDEIALEDPESYVATLTLAPGTPSGVVLGSQTTTTISVADDDGESVCVCVCTNKLCSSALLSYTLYSVHGWLCC